MLIANLNQTSFNSDFSFAENINTIAVSSIDFFLFQFFEYKTLSDAIWNGFVRGYYEACSILQKKKKAIRFYYYSVGLSWKTSDIEFL